MEDLAAPSLVGSNKTMSRWSTSTLADATFRFTTMQKSMTAVVHHDKHGLDR